jgi:hypothetical protein
LEKKNVVKGRSGDYNSYAVPVLPKWSEQRRSRDGETNIQCMGFSGQSGKISFYW